VIGKPHGLKGEIVVKLTTNLVEERTSAGQQLWLEGHGRVEVESVRPKADAWLFQFSSISNRDEVDKLKGAAVFAERVADFLVTDLIGVALQDSAGTDLGSVVSIVANPASDLLELDSGALIPRVFLPDEEHVLEGLKRGVVEVDIPDGLI
jgi:16S rRNA processing protein RimM